MVKPTVLYSYLQTTLDPETIGKSVVLFPHNHPGPYVSNTKLTITSPVVSYTDDGTIETENTIYGPRDKQETSSIQSNTGTETPAISTETEESVAISP